MSKYLYTERANAQFKLPDFRLLTQLHGRTWRGIAAVSDETAKLAQEKYPGLLREISKEDFEELKKNWRKAQQANSHISIAEDPTKPPHAHRADNALPVQESSEDAVDLLIAGDLGAVDGNAELVE
jgi:hypothetical protein